MTLTSRWVNSAPVHTHRSPGPRQQGQIGAAPRVQEGRVLPLARRRANLPPQRCPQLGKGERTIRPVQHLQQRVGEDAVTQPYALLRPRIGDRCTEDWYT